MNYSIEVLKMIADDEFAQLMTPKGQLWHRLLKRLPEKYWDRLGDFYAEDGLIDGCKYIIEFADPYVWGHDYKSIPVKSVTEAIKFIKETWI